MSKTTTIEVPTEWVKMTSSGSYSVKMTEEIEDICREAVKRMRPRDTEPIDAYEELTKAKDLLLLAINTPEIRKRMESDLADWLNRVRDSKGDVRPITGRRMYLLVDNEPTGPGCGRHMLFESFDECRNYIDESYDDMPTTFVSHPPWPGVTIEFGHLRLVAIEVIR